MSQDEEPPAPALLERLAEGELRLHELEEVVDADRAAEVRRRFIEEETGAELSSVANFGFEAAAATSNIENMIGATQVPLGVVGPIRLAGGASDGRCWLPLATTEGALIASVNRGLSAIRRAGGATGRVLANSMTRGPVFRVPDVGIAAEVVTWVQAHEDQLRQAAEATTSHGELEQITPYVVGNNVFLRFGYDTKDAMGMNMATIATQAACELVEAETDAESHCRGTSVRTRSQLPSTPSRGVAARSVPTSSFHGRSSRRRSIPLPRPWWRSTPERI